MTDFDLLKTAGFTPFNQLIDKNFNMGQERKVIISGKAAFPSLDIGRANVKGVFSLFRSTERYITPLLSIDHENFFKIKYNCLKSSAQINLNLPKDSLIKTLNYQLTPDKSNSRLQQNKITLYFKNQFKFSLNYDSNEQFLHLSKSFKDFGSLKYVLSHKGKNNLHINMNNNLFSSNIQYFNSLDFPLKSIKTPARNTHGLLLSYSLSPMFSLNAIGGIGFSPSNQFQRGAIGFYSKHTPVPTSSFKFENCFIMNIPKLSQCSFATGLTYKNIQAKVKLAKAGIMFHCNIKVKNITFGGNLHYEKSFKYSINLNLK